MDLFLLHFPFRFLRVYNLQRWMLFCDAELIRHVRGTTYTLCSLLETLPLFSCFVNFFPSIGNRSQTAKKKKKKRLILYVGEKWTILRTTSWQKRIKENWWLLNYFATSFSITFPPKGSLETRTKTSDTVYIKRWLLEQGPKSCSFERIWHLASHCSKLTIHSTNNEL